MYGLENFIFEHTFLFIVLVIAYIGLIGGMGAWLAEKKGYSPRTWFFLCLLSGFVGFIVLAGAPCQYTSSSLNEIIKKLDAKSSESPSGSKPVTPMPSVRLSGKTWTCKKCQEENPATANSCKSCGEYR